MLKLLIIFILFLSSCTCTKTDYYFNKQLFNFQFSYKSDNTIEFDSEKSTIRYAKASGKSNEMCLKLTFTEMKYIYDFIVKYKLNESLQMFPEYSKNEDSKSIIYSLMWKLSNNEKRIVWRDFSYTEFDVLASEIIKILEQKPEFQTLISEKR